MDFEIEDYDCQNDFYILNILPEPVIKLSKKAKEYVPTFVNQQNLSYKENHDINKPINSYKEDLNQNHKSNPSYYQGNKKRQMSTNFNNENSKIFSK